MYLKNISKLIVCVLAVCLLFSFSCFAESYGDNEVTDDFVVMKGDVNDDETVNICDMIRLTKYIDGDITEKDLNLANANVKADDEINAYDLVALRVFLLSI